MIFLKKLFSIPLLAVIAHSVGLYMTLPSLLFWMGLDHVILYEKKSPDENCEGRGELVWKDSFTVHICLIHINQTGVGPFILKMPFIFT